MSITPDGRTIFLPSYEGPYWHVVDASTGDVLARIVTNSGAHNTICSLDGSRAYLAGLHSPMLRVADAGTHAVVREVGPFGNVIRPLTVDAAGSRCYVNVNELLGFEIGDLRTGAVLQRAEVPGFRRGAVKRHGCPSHGIGLTPDETELWVCDGANSRVHVFDATAMPPRLTHSIAVRDQPGWVTFTLDGRFAIPSTGEVIDVRSKRVTAALSDESGRPVQSEKLLEIVFSGGRAVRVGDQFGLGRRGTAPV
jgi:DNA-binding beta-propeller fold protein YncE